MNKKLPHALTGSFEHQRIYPREDKCFYATGYKICTYSGMINKKLQLQLAKVAKQFKSTFSFRQMPPIEYKKTEKKGNSPESLDATDLFSHFTADIIKEKVTFMR